MSKTKSYHSGNLARSLGISRAAIAQAKRKHPQWFVKVGEQGNAVLYQAAGINRWLKYRRQQLILQGKIK